MLVMKIDMVVFKKISIFHFIQKLALSGISDGLKDVKCIESLY